MTARKACESVKRILMESKIAEPEAKARVIAAHALDIPFADIYSAKEISEEERLYIDKMAIRCAKGEPVEYVTGTAYFRYLTLKVTPDVLIPRKETELVAEKAIELIREHLYIKAADVCTGSGCISISIATETNAEVIAGDISEKALALAEQNAACNGAEGRISFVKSDMLNKMPGKYDIIVCNPPYVSESEYAALDDGVRLYEPKAALLAGDGYEFYRRIAVESREKLKTGGALVLEIGASQAAVADMLKDADFIRAEVYKDYAGLDRIACAYWEPKHV